MNEWEWHLIEDRTPVNAVRVDGVEVKPGDRVKLRPRARGDVLDIALTGRIATVESIEQDYEGQLHLAVVVDDDPGCDIGMMRQPGHRFFFSMTEVEPVEPFTSTLSANQTSTILIAGIGNIFLGDDAFGVEVVSRLASRTLPAGVRTIDFGIRGLDLAYALSDGADVSILVDACPRGGAPGDLYLVEPDLYFGEPNESSNPAIDAHGMNPVAVLRTARAMGGSLKRILLLGCEPQTLGPEEGHLGLSEPVAAAVERAVALLESVIARLLNGEWPLQSNESQPERRLHGNRTDG